MLLDLVTHGIGDTGGQLGRNKTRPITRPGAERREAVGAHRNRQEQEDESTVTLFGTLGEQKVGLGEPDRGLDNLFCTR